MTETVKLYFYQHVHKGVDCCYNVELVLQSQAHLYTSVMCTCCQW